MAYSPPDIYTHGTIPTAASFNKYSDSLDAIYAMLLDARINMFSKLIQDPNKTTIVHQKRWLHYRNPGTMQLVGGSADQTLELNAAGNSHLDLHSVPWLAYGNLYQVSGCNFAMEHDRP